MSGSDFLAWIGPSALSAPSAEPDDESADASPPRRPAKEEEEPLREKRRRADSFHGDVVGEDPLVQRDAVIAAEEPRPVLLGVLVHDRDEVRREPVDYRVRGAC